MSVREKREACGYTEKPTLPTCSNCVHVVRTQSLPKWAERKNTEFAEVGMKPPYTVERHGKDDTPECGRHGFKVKALATCRDWEGSRDAH